MASGTWAKIARRCEVIHFDAIPMMPEAYAPTVIRNEHRESMRVDLILYEGWFKNLTPRLEDSEKNMQTRWRILRTICTEVSRAGREIDPLTLRSVTWTSLYGETYFWFNRSCDDVEECLLRHLRSMDEAIRELVKNDVHNSTYVALKIGMRPEDIMAIVQNLIVEGVQKA